MRVLETQGQRVREWVSNKERVKELETQGQRVREWVSNKGAE